MRKSYVFWPLVCLFVLTDCTTKAIAVESLTPPYIPHDVVGDVVRFTLAYNTDAAMGASLGAYSRWGFAALTVLALGVLGQIYRKTGSSDRWRAVALALVCGGALGNLIDRLRWSRGVVDFIDIGIGDSRFWVFNVADVGVTVGAALLAALLWKHEDEGTSGSAAPVGRATV